MAMRVRSDGALQTPAATTSATVDCRPLPHESAHEMPIGRLRAVARAT
jgi:hypothetical protein